MSSDPSKKELKEALEAAQKALLFAASSLISQSQQRRIETAVIVRSAAENINTVLLQCS